MRQESKAPVVVLNPSVNGLSLIRCLGRAGIPVFVLETRSGCVGPSSRFSRRLKFPGFSLEAAILALRQGDHPSGIIDDFFVLPCSDVDAIALAEISQEVLPNERSINSSIDSINRLVNKDEAYGIVESLDIPVPRTAVMNPQAVDYGIQENFSQMKFLKPARSAEFRRDNENRRGFPVSSSHQLDDAVSRIKGSHQMLLQDVVPGHDSNILLYTAYVTRAGYPVAEFTGRKLRQQPSTFGAACVLRGEKNPLIQEYSRRIIHRVGYRGGIIGIEYKQDTRSRKCYFIETSVRAEHWHAAAEASGALIALAAHRDYVLDDPPAPGDELRFADGVTWVDAISLLWGVFLRSDGYSYRDLKFLADDNRIFAVCELGDPAPALDWIRYLASMKIRSFTTA